MGLLLFVCGFAFFVFVLVIQKIDDIFLLVLIGFIEGKPF